MKRKVKLGLLTLVASLIMISFLGGCGSTDAVALPTTDLAAMQTAAPLDRITVRGAVESVTSRNIYSHLGFNVESVYVEVGDVVTAGQTLAVLDTTELEFTIAQQSAALELARQNSELALRDAQRMFNEMPALSTNAINDARRMFNTATANLANNTNMHILGAEATLHAAQLNLAAAQRDHELAVRDYDQGSNILVLTAESALASARADLDVLQDTTERLQVMYDEGFLAREELRQSQTALAAAQSRYDDAYVAHRNTAQTEQRTLEMAEIALDSAYVAQQNAETMLAATRTVAQQEVDALRSNLANIELAAGQDIETLRTAVMAAEVATNLEVMEITLLQLQSQLEDATITAPVSGTVTAVITTEGAPAMGLMFVVEDTDNLRIITAFREYDIASVHEGMGVAITADATGATIHNGIINRISPVATVGLPIVEFETEILITSEDSNLRIGMNTRIDLEVSQ